MNNSFNVVKMFTIDMCFDCEYLKLITPQTLTIQLHF